MKESKLVKYCVIQAPTKNRRPVYIGDDATGIQAMDALALLPGEKYTIDIDTNRAVGVDLSEILYAGDYGGDKLTITYLEEV